MIHLLLATGYHSCCLCLQGRLTLLMGPPRSGKSLFMQMLGGMLIDPLMLPRMLQLKSFPVHALIP